MPDANRRDTAPVARDFYERLTDAGFTLDQVIQLATTLVDLVGEDLRAAGDTRTTAPAK